MLGVLVGGQVVAGWWLEVSAVVAAMAAAIADAVMVGGFGGCWSWC